MKSKATKERLFEIVGKLDKTFKLNEENIYLNKYMIKTINEPIIPDAIEVISKNPNAIKFTNKSEYNSFAKNQQYFSASHSHSFYNKEENDSFSQNGSKYDDQDAEQSDILFETGHEIVQVWDNKNNIGFIIPADKTYSRLSQLKMNEYEEHTSTSLKNDYGFEGQPENNTIINGKQKNEVLEKLNVIHLDINRIRDIGDKRLEQPLNNILLNIVECIMIL